MPLTCTPGCRRWYITSCWRHRCWRQQGLGTRRRRKQGIPQCGIKINGTKDISKTKNVTAAGRSSTVCRCCSCSCCCCCCCCCGCRDTRGCCCILIVVLAEDRTHHHGRWSSTAGFLPCLRPGFGGTDDVGNKCDCWVGCVLGVLCDGRARGLQVYRTDVCAVKGGGSWDSLVL
jgi:hypothetical protein